MSKWTKIVFTILTILLGSVCILAGALLAYSPGEPKPHLDQTGNKIKGSISEKTFVAINGVEQGMVIKSKDETHPVLLFLHGGMPEYFLNQKYPNGLEDYFTVVYCEQRGSGISYKSNSSTSEIRLEQMEADALAVTNFLRNRFNKDKIYIMAHSGGGFIWIQGVAKAPELLYAYIGVGQMSNQFESE